MLLYFPCQKVATYCKEQNKKRILKIDWKTKKLFKFEKCQEIPKKFKIFSLKISNGTVMFENPLKLSK